ncbi:MAG: DUF1295 domain-containing protein, partial [Acidobacteriota bacterium]
DVGEVTGRSADGGVERGESLLERVRRLLEEQCSDTLSKLPPIKEKAFVFHREGVSQYAELVSRLETAVEATRAALEDRVKAVELSASEGEVVTDLGLDPITERYLVLRLLEECRTAWVPEAKAAQDKAKAQDLKNPKVRERLKVELFDSLREVASEKRLFRRGDQAFLDARDEAQDFYRKVAEAAKRLHAADVSLRQRRQLVDYLTARARQYARLANHMDGLVRDLEAEAGRLERGERAVARPLALRVEVFETLEEPRTRLWDGVYKALYLDEGRHLGTFDRRTLAETITAELRPEVRGDGRVVQKSVDRTVEDLRGALLELGRRRLRPAIFGGDAQSGLDLGRGLELEARLALGAGADRVDDGQVEAYVRRKIRALSQLAGVLARVDASEARALDDGVVVNRTRQLIVGEAPGGGRSSLSGALESMLEAGGFQVKVDTWHDPRIAIVHDVVLPIPLYYIQPVVEEVEEAYLRLAADEKRPYHLHTDFNWEKTLPNLNPQRSEVGVDWSLRMLARGLLLKVIAFDEGLWRWTRHPNFLGEIGFWWGLWLFAVACGG